MTAIQPIGKIPSPYGTMIAVYFDRTRAANEGDCYFHDLDGCLDMAGVHGLSREECRKSLTAALARGKAPLDIFLAHGGQRVPHVSICPPRKPVYPTLPLDSPSLPIENWVTLVMEQRNWTDRASALLRVIGDNRKNVRAWDVPMEIPALALQLVLTAAVEHVGDQEIGCLEAAAIYALTAHKGWSAAALRWLHPVRATWLKDWIAARPVYAAFAADCRKVDPALPEWIAGGGE